MATKAALYEDLNRVLEDLTGLEAQYLDLAEAVRRKDPDLDARVKNILDAGERSGLLLDSLQCADAGMRMRLSGWPLAMLARIFHAYLDGQGAENYIETRFVTGSGKPCVAILARSSEQTPHALRTAAEARAEKAEAELARFRGGEDPMTVAAWNELEAAHRTRESTPTERTLRTSLRAKRQELDDLRRSTDEAVRAARNETVVFRARVAELEQALAEPTCRPAAEIHTRFLREGVSHLRVRDTPCLGFMNDRVLLEEILLRHETPAEAAEALEAQGFCPPGWFSPREGRAHQCRCWNRAQAKLKSLWSLLANPLTFTCPHCKNKGRTETPVGWVEVLGWALQDPAAVLRAEELATVVARRYLPRAATPLYVWSPLPPTMDYVKNPLRPQGPLLVLTDGVNLLSDGTYSVKADPARRGNVAGLFQEPNPTCDETLSLLDAMGARIETLREHEVELRYPSWVSGHEN